MPVNASKAKCAAYAGVVICLYIVENSGLPALVGSQTYNLVLKPVLWSTVALLPALSPAIRPQGKLRLRGSIIGWALTFSIIFVIVSLFAGLVDGFGKSPYDHTLFGMLMNILVVGSALVGREFIRNYFVQVLARKESYLGFFLIALFMTLFSFSTTQYTKLEGLEATVKFIAQYFLPELSKNLFVSYLAFLGGPLPAILYMAVISGFHWLSPILPDLQWITAALTGILCPVFSFIAMQSIYAKEARIRIKRNNAEESPGGWIVTSLLSIAIIWFSVGVFPVYPSVIATGSMEPMIMPGDVILVKKIDTASIKVGDVIQFKREDILISHRVIAIVENSQNGTKSYRTKGDNNNSEDNEPVTPERVKGKIIQVVPKVGWPTLLIKSRNDVPLDKVEF